MKPKHLLILLAAAGLLAVVLFNDAPTQTPTGAAEVPTEEDWHEAFRQVRKWDVPIDLQFEDEEGNPLSDVVVQTYVIKPGSWEASGELTNMRVPGSSVHLEYDGAMGVQITIAKEDYKGDNLRLDFLHPPDWAVIAPDKREQTYEKTIILRKPRASKERYGNGNWLISPPDGPVDILVLEDLHLPGVSRPSEEHPWTFERRQVEITTNTLVTDYAYLYVDVVDDPTEPGVFRSDSWETYTRLPTGKAMELGLRSDNPDDGLILIEPQDSDHQREKWTNEMYPFPDRTNTAPAHGYTKRIKVPHEIYVDDEARPLPKMFFYFRLDGYYGRGRLQEVVVDKDLLGGGRVFVEIQPDGTREIDY